VLRAAIREGAAWVPMADLVAAVRPENQNSFGVALWNMEGRGQVRVDRSLGRKRRRFALFTPGEVELLLTQLNVYTNFSPEWLLYPAPQNQFGGGDR
jgi:hypothetical protein